MECSILSRHLMIASAEAEPAQLVSVLLPMFPSMSCIVNACLFLFHALATESWRQTSLSSSRTMPWHSLTFFMAAISTSMLQASVASFAIFMAKSSRISLPFARSFRALLTDPKFPDSTLLFITQWWPSHTSDALDSSRSASEDATSAGCSSSGTRRRAGAEGGGEEAGSSSSSSPSARAAAPASIRAARAPPGTPTSSTKAGARSCAKRAMAARQVEPKLAN
mmetsp:Transcript_74570/g.210900  ORF Transcript_74570/g.210900 Transcript_74570/m.210900 type:complete len:223 (-) Transcript_74570:44-712(-)